MKRYIKSFNYEVDEHGYPTHDGISFVSDSDMLDYLADDGETEVTVNEPDLIEYDVIYVDNDTDMPSHYFVDAHSKQEAEQIARNQLGRDCYHIIDVLD